MTELTAMTSDGLKAVINDADQPQQTRAYALLVLAKRRQAEAGPITSPKAQWRVLSRPGAKFKAPKR